MAIYNDLPIYKASYDLLIEIFHFVKNFSKEYKYTVGDNLKKEMIDLMMLIYRANSYRDKISIIQEAREKIEVIRLLVRLMKDLRQINLPLFVQVNERIELVSRQLSGWQKSCFKGSNV